ncbi:hypothetical protein RCG17_24415 [Neobacillus sp. PS3-12]|uniref:hypothetical protein n=1 Tax=Neobacillus sp. PS3-12 TaxID=3070677 RepID=UPI0027E17C01|nr:hypothetical protein [Neobacillus sp. PS3-12]WML52479.1 hypothetical protein RCG17_24415 [Neobacillus sp. PS3-12]
MKVEWVTDYLAEGYPVLHLPPNIPYGAYLHFLPGLDSALLSIIEEKFTDYEMDLLMNYPIEIGAFENHQNLLLLAKIGPNEDPFIYTIPLDPVVPLSQPVIDKWIASRILIVTLIAGKEEKLFRAIRLLGIPNEVPDYTANNWIECITQGSRYSIKYNNFMESTLDIDPLNLWDQSRYLGVLER